MMKKFELSNGFHLVEVKLTKKKRFKQVEKPIQSSIEVGCFFQSILSDKDREWLCAIGLDIKGYINYLEVINIGTLNQAIIHPREVFKSAIIANSNAIIMAHNHPSGDVQPSESDRRATYQIGEAGKILGIELLDHLIIAEDKYYSIKENKTYEMKKEET
jgi:DNA repair protein RadC